MDYKDNINYRHTIERKVFESKKLTDSEKWWCLSNPVFNERCEYPCYKRDVISVLEGSSTIITVTALSYSDHNKIYRPVISVVGKGAITVENALIDLNGNKCDGKKTRILVPLFDANRKSVSFSANSKFGLISIAYQCEYYDEAMRVHICEFSDGAKLSYGMKKDTVADNEFVYYCKDPTVDDNAFDSFVFSVKISI